MEAAALRAFGKRFLFSRYFVLVLSAAYFMLFCAFTPALASGANLKNIFAALLPLLIVAVGQTFVLITGGIDLSAPAVMGLASVVGGSIMTADGGLLAGSALAAPAGAASMLLAGALIGALNGLAVAWARMPAFIVTLTVQMFGAGFAIWYAHRFGGSQSIYNLPSGFNAVGREPLFTFLIAAAIAAAAHAALSRSLYGRWLYAIGRNAVASSISGVPVRRAVAWAYVLSGLSAAVAAIVYTGRLETASAAPNEQRFLDVIAAAVIGGTSLFGGKGTVLGTAFGVLFITVLDNSLSFLGLSLFAVLMFKGGVILAAALLDTVRARLLGGG